MVKGSKYLPIATPCQQLSANNQYMRTENNVVPYVTTTCTEQLMQFQNNLSHCTRYTHIIEREEYKVTPIIQLPEIDYRNTSIFPPIDIKGINLDDVKHLSTVLKTKSVSESESEIEPIIKINSVNVGTIVVYLIVIILFLTFICKKFKIKLFTIARNPQEQNSSDGFELEGGGVMLAQGVRT
ncbi:unnamed protein product [Euphydryas editha]|uniref:Uncharacterized protein n=1 Tax=Euphydryas editha TaxID=104508 RepID=A0AAU9TQM4_EUPED|nr:unnamed protein product [Euphydryas editha]